MENFLQMFGGDHMAMKMRTFYAGVTQDNSMSFLQHFPAFHPNNDLGKYLKKMLEMDATTFSALLDRTVSKAPHRNGLKKLDRMRCASTFKNYAKKDREEFVNLIAVSIDLAFAKEGDPLRNMCVGLKNEEYEDGKQMERVGGDKRQAHVFRYIHAFCLDGKADDSNFQEICFQVHTYLTFTLIEAHDDPDHFSKFKKNQHHDPEFLKPSGSNSHSHSEPPRSGGGCGCCNKSAPVERSTGPCEKCGAPGADKKCARCMKVFYCNKSCQQTHWKAHKKQCLKLRSGKC